MIPALTSLNSPLLLFEDYFFRKNTDPRYLAAVDKFRDRSLKNRQISRNSSLCSSLESSPNKICPQNLYHLELSIFSSPLQISPVERTDNDQSFPSPIEDILSVETSLFDNNQSPSPDKYNFIQEDLSRTDYISCVIEPSEKLGGLFISDIECAQDIQLLQSYGITNVLSIDRNSNFVLPNSIKQMHLIAFDTEMFQLKKHFQNCFEFIHSALLDNKNILVHCQRGVSRSAAIIISFLIKFYSYSYDEAYDYLKKRRPVIRPNKGFISQLQAYEKFIKRYAQY